MFPVGKLPMTPYVNQELIYFNTDIETRQIDTGYNSDISYSFNSHGYRSPEFTQQGDINLLSIGCSVTFGNGIPVDKRFGDVFASLLSNNTQKTVVNWNMAMPGESIDYIVRTSVLAIPILKPDILITNFPSFARREFFDNNGNRFDYRPKRQVDNRIEKELFSHLENLSSYYDDLARFFINYKLIESVVELYNCKWLYALQKCDLEQYAEISVHCRDEWRVPSLQRVDVARDNGHPGVETNRLHGVNYYDKYMAIHRL